MEYYDINKYFDPKYQGLIGNYFKAGMTDELGRRIPKEGWVDGGDTLNRVGLYHCGLFYRREMGASEAELAEYPFNKEEDFDKALDMLESPTVSGWYIRHPDPDFWYSRPGVNSRDQDSPVVIGMGLMNKKRLFRYFLQHMKRLFLFNGNTRRNGASPKNHGNYERLQTPPALSWWQKLVIKYKIPIFTLPEGYRNYNWKMPDISGFEFFSYYIRATNIKILYPLLLILDLDMLVNAIIKKYNKKEYDIINHMNSCCLAYFRMPTPITWFINRYLHSSEDFKNRLHNYFDTKRSPGFLIKLWSPVLDKVMRGKTK